MARQPSEEITLLMETFPKLGDVPLLLLHSLQKPVSDGWLPLVEQRLDHTGKVWNAKRKIVQLSACRNECVEFQGLNHLFQKCKTGAIAEYGQIEETIAPEVLAKISDWIAARK